MSKKNQEIQDDFDLSNFTTNQKRKKVNSRAKGNRFENKVAKLFNQKFNTKEFSRTPGSGAFATTHKLPSYMKIYGDLITPEKFRFIIECKKGYNGETICDLFNNKSDVSDMIVKAERDSQNSSKPFLLIIGQDRKDPVVITNDVIRYDDNSQTLEGTIKNIGIKMFKLKDLLSRDSSYFFDE